MKKWVWFLYFGLSLSLQATDYIVINNDSTQTSGSFAEGVSRANTGQADGIVFSTPSPYTISLAITVTLAQSYTINGQNDGNGFIIGPATAQKITIQSGVTTTFTSSTGIMTLNSALVSGSTAAITKEGAGTLILGGTSDFFQGAVNLSAGQITLANSLGLGTGALSMSDGTTLALNASIAPSNNITLSGTNTIDVSSGTSSLTGILSGSGAILEKTGAGILELSAANTYSGGTTLSAGQITLANSAGLGTGLLEMSNNTILSLGGVSISNEIRIESLATASFSVATGTATNLYGVIQNTNGVLKKIGGGNLALSQSNQHTGGTVLSEGTISLQNNHGLGSGTLAVQGSASLGLINNITASNPINIANSQTLSVSVGNSQTATLSGATASTSGILTKIGNGILVLSGANQHTGGTTVSSGQIDLENSTGLGTGTLTLQSGTTLAIRSDLEVLNPIYIPSGSATISVRSGTAYLIGESPSNPGTIIKTGVGTLVLSGNNQHNGGVTIEEGQITLENNAGLGSGNTLTMQNGTTLGVGDGILAPNTVTMTGASGTLSVESSSTGGLSGDITGASGGTTKAGGGNFVLGSGGTFTGDMSVTDGTLTVNGTHDGDVTVQDGANLKGTGTVTSDVTINDGGSITPGNSIGTITLGTLSLEGGAITNIELDPLESSVIDVTGLADINGTVNLIQQPGAYGNSGRYEILTAGSLTGQFDPVITGAFSNLDFSFDYSTANSVFINYINTGINTYGLTGNMLLFANYLNESASRSLEFNLLASLSGEALVNGINSASPARNVFGTYVITQTLFSFSHLLNNYLGGKRFSLSEVSPKLLTQGWNQDSLEASIVEVQCKKSLKKCQSGVDFWITGFGDFARQQAESQNAPFDFTSQGILVGLDYKSVDNWLFGGAFAFAGSLVTIDEGMGQSTIYDWMGSLYGYYSWENISLEGAIWGGGNQIENDRNIAYATLYRTAHSDVHGWQIAPHIEAMVMFSNPYTYLEPYLALDYVFNWQGEYLETNGGNLNMKVQRQTSSMLQTEVGIRFLQQVENPSIAVSFKEEMAFVNQVPFEIGNITAALVGIPQTVSLASLSESQNLASIGFTFLVQPTEERDMGVTLGYHGQFGPQYIFNEVMLTLIKEF
jgi:autotransporter-associated beta strand protein